MRKPAILLTFTLAAATAMAQTGLPTVDQVVEKYVQALGGKAALEKLTSRYTKGTVDVVTFNAGGTFELFEKAPAKRMMKSVFDGYGEVLQVCDGTVAWMETPDAGHRDLSGAELATQKRAADFYGALHMKEHYPKMAVTSKTKVGARDAYLVELTPAEGAVEKAYFDVENGLMLRTDAQSNDGAVTILFEDYKELDGAKEPYTMKIDMPNVSLVYKATEIKHEVAMEDAKFAKPAAK